MSPPRRHYGPKPPGRLEATLLKVAAAELTDGARLGRGKRYFADDAVTDVLIEPGVAEVWVQGSRAEPYLVSLRVTSGDGVPTAVDIDGDCNCVDSQRGAFCKHCVAGVFAVANEIAIEPELLSTWRSGGLQRSSRAHAAAPSDLTSDTASAPNVDAPATSTDASGHLADVIELFGERGQRPQIGRHRDHHDGDRDGDDDDDAAESDDPAVAQINAMLVNLHNTYPHSPIPSPDELDTPLGTDGLERTSFRSTGDDTLDTLLRSAFDEFDLGWS